MGSGVFLSIVVQQLVVILGILQEKMSTHPSTPPSGTSLTGATLFCGALSSHCSGFPWCRAEAPDAWTSVVAACGPWSAGSVVVHRLRCSIACGILPGQLEETHQSVLTEKNLCQNT